MGEFNFEEVETGASLPWDIGGQAALNDMNRWMFDAFKGFKDEDQAWADMRKSEFGKALFEKLMEFDEWEFNGSANPKDDDAE